MEPQPIRWELGNAPKQSITEVLQNPHGKSLTLPELSAFDLSNNATPQAPRPPLLDINHFEDYLRRYAPLHTAFVKEKSRLDVSASAPSQQTPIPELYFSSEFSVASNPHLVRMQPRSNDETISPSEVDQLRESLASQRSSLEEQLRRTLTDQSQPITAALERSRTLREQIISTAHDLRKARTKATELVPTVVDGLQLIRAVLGVQENARAVRSALGLLQDVVNAPEDVADLIRTTEYEGAIRVVGEAKEALGREELARVGALASVRGKLARAVESIDAALRDEFREALRSGKGQEETLSYIVQLVDSMGRLPLLQRVFLKEVRAELAKELVQAESIGAACRVVKASAKRSVMIVNIIHDGKAGNASLKEGTDLKEVREEMEDMLSSAVDRFLGSFSTSTATATKSAGANAGFVVITDTDVLTEQTCFDEFKGAFRFGEELRMLGGMVRELDEIFSSERRSGSLRAKISERQIAFLSTFHKAHVDVLTNSVRGDKWQEIKVSQGVLRLLAAVLDDTDGNINGQRIDQSKSATAAYISNNHQEDAMEGMVILNGGVFRMVACGVRYLRSLCAYTLLTEKSPTLAQEVARRGAELSRLFNSLIGRAILGAQALQWSGLRSITARHLALASRTIAMAVALANRVNKSLENALPESQAGVILPLIQKSEKDLRDHHGQLLAKILTIMMDRLEAHEEVLKSLPWEKAQEMQRFDVPSAYITTLIKEAIVLHRILWSILPDTEVSDIFQRVCAAYGSHLTEAYGSLDGRKIWIRSRVAEDVSCLHERLHILEVFKANPAAIKPISMLYSRFAKEYNDEKDRIDSKEVASLPNRTVSQKAEGVPNQHVSSSASEPPQDRPEDQTSSDDGKRIHNNSSMEGHTAKDLENVTAPDSNGRHETAGVPPHDQSRAPGVKSEAPVDNAKVPIEEASSEGTQYSLQPVEKEKYSESGGSVADATLTLNDGPNLVSNDNNGITRAKRENGSDTQIPPESAPPDEAFEEEMKKMVGTSTDQSHETANGTGENLQFSPNMLSIPPEEEGRISKSADSVKVPEGVLRGPEEPTDPRTR